MKLKQACDMGLACGLDTIKEAVDNIVIHGTSLFSYDNVVAEIEELLAEAETLNCDDKLIEDIFPELALKTKQLRICYTILESVEIPEDWDEDICLDFAKGHAEEMGYGNIVNDIEIQIVERN